MRCKAVQRWLIDRAKENLEKNDSARVERHVSQCARCADLRRTLEYVRTGFSQMGMPGPPPDLVERTRTMCHEQLAIRRPSIGTHPEGSSTQWIPRPIWAAVIGLIVLTGICSATLMKDISWERELSLSSVLGLTMIVQNTILLFFAPVLLRKCRASRTEDRAHTYPSMTFSLFHGL